MSNNIIKNFDKPVHLKIDVPCSVYAKNILLPLETYQYYIDNATQLKDIQNHTTNVKAAMSSWWIWKETEIFNSLLDRISEEFKQSPLYSFPVGDKNPAIELSSAWIAVYRRDQGAVLHNHKGSSCSFCYYIKAEEDSAPLCFPEGNIDIKPQTGTLVLFDGNLNHYVPPSTNDEERIILAGNFN